MTEKELLEKIMSSAEQVEVPESLSPDSIKKKLDAAVASGELRQEEAQEVVQKKNHWYSGRKIVAAAAVLLVCGTGVMATYRMADGNSDMSSAGMEMAESAIENNASTGDSLSTNEGEAEDVKERLPKTNAGDMYIVAENYEDVYDLLKEQEEPVWDLSFSGATDGAVLESAPAEDIATGTNSYSSSTTAGMEESAQELQSTMRGDKNYSKTNLQTEGVDESDIIKTDGDYIYIVDSNKIRIIDIRDREMEEIAEIPIALTYAADNIVEMYVDGDILNVIVEHYKTDMQEDTVTTGTGEAEVTTCYAYSIDTSMETELMTYDISDRTNPVLTGSCVQDGSYHTSRKVGDIIYLFTQKYIVLPDMSKRNAVEETAVTSWIPTVNDTAIAADSIYLPEQGRNGLIISSIDVKKPNSIVDNLLIMNDYVNIYVGSTAIYLYEGTYEGSGYMTKIAKFSYKDGIMNAVGATAVTGDIYDTFAINEYQGKLRVLTTDWSGRENDNQLFLLDENLNLTGSLKGIATGESVYAARYFGDMVYFVTYRNTDPLFAVDLSDEQNPKILSELKITGFSEYLHFWGEDKLVGIGYETDPDTGRQEGIKLTMFDISDPANITAIESKVFENLNSSPALHNYKSVLIDKSENLIGFAGENYDNDLQTFYLLYAWEDNSFKPLLVEEFKEYITIADYRGIYVEDMFYFVSTRKIISYDRADNYQKVDSIEW